MLNKFPNIGYIVDEIACQLWSNADKLLGHEIWVIFYADSFCDLNNKECISLDFCDMLARDELCGVG